MENLDMALKRCEEELAEAKERRDTTSTLLTSLHEERQKLFPRIKVLELRLQALNVLKEEEIKEEK